MTKTPDTEELITTADVPWAGDAIPAGTVYAFPAIAVAAILASRQARRPTDVERVQALLATEPNTDRMELELERLGFDVPRLKDDRRRVLERFVEEVREQ